MSDWQFNVGDSRPPRKSTGLAGTVFLFLFGTPFAAGGIFAWVQSVREFNRGRTRDAAMLLLFGLVFCGVGFGLMVGSLWAGRKARQDARQQAGSPDQPWLWRKDWAAGRVKSSGKSATIFLWVFTLFWNGISSFIFFMLPQELHKGNTVALIGLLFPLVGVGLLFAAIRSTLAQRRFGDCYFELAQIPAPLGGSLDGMIQTGTRLKLEHGLHLKLSCLRRSTSGSGDNRSTQETVLWQNEKVFKPDASLPEVEPGRSGIPVCFGIPTDQPECCSLGNEAIVWRLEAKAKMSGPDFSATFEVPVFKVAGFVAPKSIEPDPTAALQMPVEEIRRDENSRIKITDGPDGREFYFPAARNLGTAFFLTAFFLIWTGFVWLMLTQHAPLMFPIIFGGIDVLLAYSLFNVWFHSSRVTINPNRVCLTQRRLIFSRTREFSPGDIVRFDTKMGMTSGTRTFQDLKLVTRESQDNMAARKARFQQTGERPELKLRVMDPGGVTLASSIGSAPEAAWLVQEMTRALGRRG